MDNQSDLVFDSQGNTILHQCIKQLIENQVKNSDFFNMSIHQEDEMYIFNLEVFKKNQQAAIFEYFRVGLNVIDVIKQVINWKFKDPKNINSFLDFASGYGRITRFMIQEIEPKKIWISDIYADGVKFQTEQFEVNGIVSVSTPELYNNNQQFDCILVVSLFSHLPEATFTRWLKKLYSLMNPDGMLMFSVVSTELLPTDVTIPEKGIFFQPFSESRSLDTEEYGATWVTENYVNQTVFEVTKGKAKVYRIARGINNHQDLYIVVNQPPVDNPVFELRKNPSGCLDVCILSEPGKLLLSGWAASFEPDIPIEDVQILINEKLNQRCLPVFKRPDVARHFGDERLIDTGWQCFCPLEPEIDLTTAILKIKIVDRSHRENILYIGKLEEAIQNTQK